MLVSLCTNYSPTKQSIWITGVYNNGGLIDPYYPEEDPDKLLESLSKLYTVQVNDSTYQDLDFYFYDQSFRKEKGLRTKIYTGDLPNGKNTITLNRYRLSQENKLEENELLNFFSG